MIDDKDCMNLMGGGEGGFISDEQQRQRSIAGGKVHAEKLKNDEGYREKHIEWAYGNLSNYIKSGKHNFNTMGGKTHTEDTKRKMSEAKKGKGTGKANSQYGTCWITNGEENKKIKKEELDTFISQGWEKGRKIK